MFGTGLLPARRGQENGCDRPRDRYAPAGDGHSATSGTLEPDGAPEVWAPPSWDEVVTLHSARVYRLAYRLTGNKHDAEDLTQEVFVRVFRSLSSYTPGTFEGWLHRITTNLFLDIVRRKARIRFEALPDDAERLESRDRGPAQLYDDTHFDARRAGGARRAAAGLPGRRRALRPRGPVVRGDRRHARHQDRYRAQPDPPGPERACGPRWPTVPPSSGPPWSALRE